MKYVKSEYGQVDGKAVPEDEVGEATKATLAALGHLLPVGISCGKE